jgi:hypothetical protein
MSTQTISDLQARIADNFFKENGQKTSKMSVFGRRSSRVAGGKKKKK